MGKSKAFVVVADVTEADLELEYQQHHILEYLNGFHDSVTMLATCQPVPLDEHSSFLG